MKIQVQVSTFPVGLHTLDVTAEIIGSTTIGGIRDYARDRVRDWIVANTVYDFEIISDEKAKGEHGSP